MNFTITKNETTGVWYATYECHDYRIAASGEDEEAALHALKNEIRGDIYRGLLANRAKRHLRQAGRWPHKYLGDREDR